MKTQQTTTYQYFNKAITNSVYFSLFFVLLMVFSKTAFASPVAFENSVLRSTVENVCTASSHNIKTSISITHLSGNKYKLSAVYETGGGYRGEIEDEFDYVSGQSKLITNKKIALVNAYDSGSYLIRAKISASPSGGGAVLSQELKTYECLAQPSAPDLSNETVVVLGFERGPDGVGIRSALSVLASETGMNVKYVATGEAFAATYYLVFGGTPLIVTDPETGQPIEVDIFMINPPNDRQFAMSEGVMAPLSVTAETVVNANYKDGFKNLSVLNDTVYGVPVKADLKSLVWYSPSEFKDPNGISYDVPKTYDELLALSNTMIANGQVPWCVGIESGVATGWVVTDWIEDVVLGYNDPSIYDAWVANDIGFTDPRIRDAWEKALLILNNPDAVYEVKSGGSIIRTHFFDSILNFVDGNCMMHKQAQFAAFFMPVDFGFDVGVFAFPGSTNDGRYNTVMGSGITAHAVAQINAPGKAKAIDKTMQYLASPKYAEERQRGTLLFIRDNFSGSITKFSGFLSGVLGINMTQPVGSGSSESLFSNLEQSMLSILSGANDFRFDASDSMPPPIGAGGVFDFDSIPGNIIPNPVDGVFGSCAGVNFGGEPYFSFVDTCWFMSPAGDSGGFWNHATRTLAGSTAGPFITEADDYVYVPEIDDWLPTTVLVTTVDLGQSVNDATQAIENKFCQVAPGGVCSP